MSLLKLRRLFAWRYPPSAAPLARGEGQSASASVRPERDRVRALRDAINWDAQASAQIDISEAAEFHEIRGKIPDRTQLCKLILRSARFYLPDHEFTAGGTSGALGGGEGGGIRVGGGTPEISGLSHL